MVEQREVREQQWGTWQTMKLANITTKPAYTNVALTSATHHTRS